MAFTVDVDIAVRKLNNNIPFLQPLYEAVSNALEANATEIQVTISQDNEYALDLGPNNQRKIDGFKIYDNGDGFTKDNRTSFSNYLTNHKMDIGCKGIGRLTWLKVFENVTIDSVANNENTKIDFGLDFDPKTSIQVELNDTDSHYTIIKMSNVTLPYYKIGEDDEKTIDKRAVANVENIKNDVESHLLAKLFLLKKSDKKFQITFKLNNDIAEISDITLPELQQVNFSVVDINKDEHNFRLFYEFIDNSKNKNFQKYCGHERAVQDFTKSVSFNNLPDGYSSVFLLTSKYLDDRVNDERNKFTFELSENNGDIANPIPFPKINKILQEKMQDVISTEFPEVNDKNDDIVEQCCDSHPHLAKYIREDNHVIKDKRSLLARAEKKFQEDKAITKNKFKKLLLDKDIDIEEFSETVSEISDVSARELAEYISYRQQIIEALQRLHDDKEKQETLLHNLFMQMRTEDSSNRVESSNIWLLDDKFMSYFYMASDKVLNTIYKTIHPNTVNNATKFGRNRPDLLGVYINNSNDRELDTPQDVVVIELKGIGANKDEKNKSITEIWNNTDSIKSVFKNIQSVWSFIITDIDEDFERTLKNNLFKPCFTKSEGKIYHSYNPELDTHCYAISTEAILSDAHDRNSIFLDIIKGDKNHSINKAA